MKLIPKKIYILAVSIEPDISIIALSNGAVNKESIMQLKFTLIYPNSPKFNQTRSNLKEGKLK